MVENMSRYIFLPVTLFTTSDFECFGCNCLLLVITCLSFTLIQIVQCGVTGGYDALECRPDGTLIKREPGEFNRWFNPHFRVLHNEASFEAYHQMESGEMGHNLHHTDEVGCNHSAGYEKPLSGPTTNFVGNHMTQVNPVLSRARSVYFARGLQTGCNVIYENGINGCFVKII